MTDELFALLLRKRATELANKERQTGLNRTEQAERNAIESHRDKNPAVVQRIRILSGRNAQSSLLERFSKKYRQNRAELEALHHYGHSKAVWEIAYLTRKRACQPLSAVEKRELHFLTLYHDSPDVLRITRLKLKEESGALSAAESRELSELQRNLYRHSGVPNQVFELLWPPQTAAQPALDWSRL